MQGKCIRPLTSGSAGYYNIPMRDNARIIVEGMDGSGKTTLVDRLLGELGPDHSYLIRNDRGPSADLRAFWTDTLGVNPPGRVAIHDRFFYPELVYGPILRGRYSVESGIIQYVAQYLRYFAFLIYCRPPNDVIFRGVNVEPQMAGVLNNFDALLNQYDTIMTGEQLYYQNRFFYYDRTRDDEDDVLFKSIERYLSGPTP